MTILVAAPELATTPWANALRRYAPDRRVVVHGTDDYAPDAVRYALVWRPPQGLLAGLANLEVIFNLGAGVDALLADPSLPDRPVVRLVDQDMATRMGEWITLQVLTHHRQALDYWRQQQARQWCEREQPAAGAVRVGLMGYGVLAAHCARILAAIGFRLHGWTRTHRAADVPLYVGPSERAAFLAQTDILVVLLPLTAHTRGILDADLLAGLARDGALGGPILVNAGRGGLQNEADILAALRSGALRGASLDVFQTEPLPPDDPLWAAPNLVITPHCAAVSQPSSAAAIVAEQMARYEAGAPLACVVERGRGY